MQVYKLDILRSRIAWIFLPTHFSKTQEASQSHLLLLIITFRWNKVVVLDYVVILIQASALSELRSAAFHRLITI